jgi:hypothetical protein
MYKYLISHAVLYGVYVSLRLNEEHKMRVIEKKNAGDNVLTNERQSNTKMENIDLCEWELHNLKFIYYYGVIK